MGVFAVYSTQAFLKFVTTLVRTLIKKTPKHIQQQCQISIMKKKRQQTTRLQPKKLKTNK